MKNVFGVLVAIFALCAAAVAAPLAGVPLPGGFLDVQYSAGTGTNAAYFVVDFAGSGSSPGGAYAFAFNWDSNITPSPTPADALFTIEGASGPSTLLQMQTTDFGSSVPNLFVDTFTYGGETATPGFPSTWTLFLGSYASSQVTWGNPNDVVFGISAVDFSGNQIYSLENGHFYGFSVGSFNEQFLIEAENPRLPVAVPEPAAWVLTTLGGVLIAGRRLRKRRLLLRDAVESAQTPHQIAGR